MAVLGRIIKENGDDIKISSEQVEYEELVSQNNQNRLGDISTDDEDKLPSIKLVNRSGESGLAAKMRIQLENNAYDVSGLSSEFGKTDQNTVIVYDPEYADYALEISRVIEGALLSSFADALPEEPVIIYVGKDYLGDVQ